MSAMQATAGPRWPGPGSPPWAQDFALLREHILVLEADVRHRGEMHEREQVLAREQMGRLEKTIERLADATRSLSDRVQTLAVAEEYQQKRAQGLRQMGSSIFQGVAVAVSIILIGSVAVIIAVAMGPRPLLDAMHPRVSQMSLPEASERNH